MPQDYGNDRNINYANRDFQGIKSDLMSYIRTYFPDTFGDFNETSTGMMLVELVAYVGDVLNFYIDEQFKEMMLPTVSERKNVINLARTLGYRVKPSVPSLVEIEVELLIPSQGDSLTRTPDFSKCLVIDAGMTMGSDSSDNHFQTLEIVDFTISGSTPTEEFSSNLVLELISLSSTIEIGPTTSPKYFLISAIESLLSGAGVAFNVLNKSLTSGKDLEPPTSFTKNFKYGAY